MPRIEDLSGEELDEVLESLDESDQEAWISVPLDELEVGDRIVYVTINDDDEIVQDRTEATFLGFQGRPRSLNLKGEVEGYDEEQEYIIGSKPIDIVEVKNRDVGV